MLFPLVEFTALYTAITHTGNVGAYQIELALSNHKRGIGTIKTYARITRKSDASKCCMYLHLQQ